MSAGGCLNYDTWHFNPQFSLLSNQTQWVSVVLIQCPDIKNPDDELHPIGFYVWQAAGTCSVNMAHCVAASGRLQDIPETGIVAKAPFEEAQHGEFGYLLQDC